MSDTDLELLARYARHHAEDAFAEIVRRHLDLVHSAAFRQVRSPQLGEEVAQPPLAELARPHPDPAHPAAFRQARPPPLPEEVPQSTFINPAPQARQLAPDT